MIYDFVIVFIFLIILKFCLVLNDEMFLKAFEKASIEFCKSFDHSKMFVILYFFVNELSINFIF